MIVFKYFSALFVTHFFCSIPDLVQVKGLKLFQHFQCIVARLYIYLNW